MLLNIEGEWEELKFEMKENKPKEIPEPKFIVKRRELLLIAECLLSDYEICKSQ